MRQGGGGKDGGVMMWGDVQINMRGSNCCVSLSGRLWPAAFTQQVGRGWGSEVWTPRGNLGIKIVAMGGGRGAFGR